MSGEEWTVVGALKDKPMIGNTSGSWTWNRRTIVPQSTFDAIYNQTHEATHVFIRLQGSETLAARLDAVKSLVSSAVLRRHYGVHNFKVANDDRERQQEHLILGIIEALLLSTGMLALFVGGINIMNIMLVTVTERTREIGVRRAVGATPGAILVQFLLEATLIALVGGLIRSHRRNRRSGRQRFRADQAGRRVEPSRRALVDRARARAGGRRRGGLWPVPGVARIAPRSGRGSPLRVRVGDQAAGPRATRWRAVYLGPSGKVSLR